MASPDLGQDRYPPICAGPDLDTHRPHFTLPPGAVDCHAHVFGAPERYPYAAERLYTPPAVFLAEYHAMHAALGVDRGVLVQSAIHGADNRVIVDAPGFQALIRFLRSGRGWSKLSAPYRTSRAPYPYADITAFARALVESAPERLVWGTDWPHVMLEPPLPNTGSLTDLLASWVPDEVVRRRILVDNAERLYGFRS